jgi:predicted hydrocarbon binding protein
MAAVASIKGSVFSTLVEDVAKLVASGDLSRDEALRWLEPGDLELLGQEISIASWYDVRAYDRMNRLLRDVIAHGSNEFLREKGRETARRLLEGGLYSQLEYLQHTEVAKAAEPRERFAAFGRDLRRLTTLSASILNFSRWTSRPDPERELYYVIDVAEAKEFPETLCWRSDGFVNGMATEHGASDLWRWERTAPDKILFSMTRPA